MIEHDFAVDGRVMNAIGEHAHSPAVVRKVMDYFLSSRSDRVRIEDDQVGRQTGPQQTPVIDSIGRSGVEGEAS